MDQYIRRSVEADQYRELQRVGLTTGAQYRARTLPSPIPTEGQADYLQIVDASGKVVAASESMEGKPPLSQVRPPPNDRIAYFRQCPTSANCLMITAIRERQADDSPIIYIATRPASLLTHRRLEYSLLLVGLLLLTLICWAAWTLVGRTLRPVKQISARMAEITAASDLGLRVPEPPSEGEIADLAHTANEALARLEQSVEEQRRFISDVSHELRNPVAGLSLQLEEALMERGQTDPWPVIESSLESAERLSAIIDDLRAISRLQVGHTEMEPIDLGDFVVSNALGHPKVRVRAASGLLVQGNRVRLARLLANLLNNATRHAVSRVEVTVEREGHDALLVVADDGAGVPEADREKIFERFVRLEDSKKRDPAGSGLGLPISRDIAESHGGTLVLADSERGARFELRLPLLRSATAYDSSTL